MTMKKNFFKNTVGAWIQLDSITILKIIENKNLIGYVSILSTGVPIYEIFQNILTF